MNQDTIVWIIVAVCAVSGIWWIVRRVRGHGNGCSCTDGSGGCDGCNSCGSGCDGCPSNGGRAAE